MNRQRAWMMSCLLPALVAGGVAVASAEIVPVSRAFRVSDDTGRLHERPAAAFDAAGNSVVVWALIRESADLLQEARIYGRFYDPHGEPIAPPRPVDGGRGEFQFFPDVAAIGEGRFFVVWSRFETLRFNPRFEGYDVVGRLVDAAGEGESRRFLLHHDTSFWQVYPAIAADARGHSFVVWAWNDVGDRGPWPEHVAGRRFRPDGKPARPETFVNHLGTSTVDRRFQPVVAVAANHVGEWLVVWVGEEGFGVFARPYDPQGRPRGPEVQLGAEGRHGFVYGTPAVAADAEGNFVVVWANQSDYWHPPRIFSRAFRGTRPSGPEHLVSEWPQHRGVRPAVTSDAEGRFVVAWTSLNGRWQNPRVVLRELRSDGEPAGPGRIVAKAYTGLDVSPDVAAGPDGDVLVVWAGFSSAGDLSPRIFGRRYRLR